MKTSRKKTNRRMKKSVRRTVGALCLASSIILAAIPVPENYAIGNGDSSAIGEFKSYSEVIMEDSSDNSFVAMPTSSEYEDNYTYAVREVNGSTIVKYQFKVKSIKRESSNNNGYIYGYNTNANSFDNEVVIPEHLYSDYVYIDAEVVTDEDGRQHNWRNDVTKDETYDGSTSTTVVVHVNVGKDDVNKEDIIYDIPVMKMGLKYSLGDPFVLDSNGNYKLNEDDPAYVFLNAYFKSELEAHIKAYRAFHDGTGTEPTSLKKCLLDRYNTTALQNSFIAEQILDGNIPSGNTYELTDVTMFDKDDNSKSAYIFKVTSGMSKRDANFSGLSDKKLYKDSDGAEGYLTTRFISIDAICDGAFKEIGKSTNNNISNLVIKNTITKIGNNAFEDSAFKDVVIEGAPQIGARAFANSKNLNSISIPVLTSISKEAFYGTGLTMLSVPQSITEIGDGAFANCTNLNAVEFLGLANISVKIGNAAFADCKSLKEVNFGDSKIEKLGDYCFAIFDVASRSQDQLGVFAYPNYIASVDNMGDFTVAGRNNLKEVILPSGIDASTQKVQLPSNIVRLCTGLQFMKFPNNSNGISYSDTMFYDVTNPSFYVEGPEKYLSDYAEPRQSTWKARMDHYGDEKAVPYLYYDSDGNRIYELYMKNEGNDDVGLVLGIRQYSNAEVIADASKAGCCELINCQIIGNGDTSDISLVIPADVAGLKIKEIKKGSFDHVKNNFSELIIKDGGAIETIDDDTFADCGNLKRLELGNSVRNINARAFKNCNNLSEVIIGNNIKYIGSEAFSNCTSLIDVTFRYPNGSDYITLEDIQDNAFSAGSKKMIMHGLIESGYGPFEWAMQKDNYVDSVKGLRVCYNAPSPYNMTVILDNSTLLPTLVDYQHYDDIHPSIRTKYESYINKDNYSEPQSIDSNQEGEDPAPDNGEDPSPDGGDGGTTGGDPSNDDVELTQEQIELCNNSIYMTIPSGIKSIDVNGFIKAVPGQTSLTGFDNSVSVSTYLMNNPHYDEYRASGLFNGNGYQRLKSISLIDVQELPTRVFENCKNLGTANLGSKLTKIKHLPFAGCKKLYEVYFGENQAKANDNFSIDKLIIYENKDDNSKNIIECLEARGEEGKYSYTINTTNDENLAQVSSIDDGAFSNCENLAKVDFTGATLLDEIPDGCFENCEKLRFVTCPENIVSIGDEAFATNGEYLHVTVKNKMLYLGADTNGAGEPGNGKVKDSEYLTYKNAPSAKTAKKQGYRISDPPLDNVWEVQYFDKSDFIFAEYVVDGQNAEGPDPSLITQYAGYTFTGWNKSLKNITDDMIIIAQYEPIKESTPPQGDNGGGGGNSGGGGSSGGGSGNSGSGGGSGGGSGNTSNTGTKYQLTVVYGSGSGDYASGSTVIIEAIDAPSGKVFDKWVASGASTPTIASVTSKATTLKMPGGSCTVTATYKDDDGSSKKSQSVSTRNQNGTNNSGNVVSITKSGFSNTDLAHASVSGTTDNFVVKISESSDAANAVATALAQRYGDMSAIKYFAMDISLYDVTGNTKITDTNGIKVNITVPIPDALRAYAGNNRAGAVSGTTLEDIPYKFTTVDGVPCISFTASHFSPYTIYVDTNNLTAGTIDSTPKTGDGIHPKWIASIGLFACSMFLFLKKDKRNKKVITA